MSLGLALASCRIGYDELLAVDPGSGPGPTGATGAGGAGISAGGTPGGDASTTESGASSVGDAGQSAGGATDCGQLTLTENAAPSAQPAAACAYPGALVCDDFEA